MLDLGLSQVSVAVLSTGAAAVQVIGPDTSVSTAWAGDVTQTTFTAAHTTAADTQGTRLVASTDPTFATGKVYSAYRDTATKTVQHTVNGLSADTQYYFCIEVNGTLKTTRSGQFKTMANSNSFRFAFGGCSSGTTTGKILSQVLALPTVPRFFIHLGDFHYSDISANGANPPANGTDYTPEFDAAYDAMLGGTYMGPFCRQMPMYPAHDDHDWIGNDSGAGGPAAAAALESFRRRRPTPPLAFNSNPTTDPVGFSFVQGRIRFVVPDLRSQRTSSSGWGTAQKTWFYAHVDAAYAAGQVICLVHSTPFINSAYQDAGAAPGNQLERQTIATYIVNAGMGGRIFCLTGDYHMMAADSGASVDYADLGGLRMPVFHACGISAAAVMSNVPMDLGFSFPKSSIAGYIDVTDDGTTVALAFTGIGMDPADSVATTILTHSTSLPRPVPTKPTAITLVQEGYRRFAGTDGTGSGPTTYTVSPKSTPTSGNLLVLFVGMPRASNTGTLAAPSGWTRLGSDQVVANQFHQAIFYKISNGTETSVTITTSGQRVLHTALMEFSGVNTVTPFGQDVADLDAGSTRATFAPSFTTTNDNEVALVFGQTSNFNFTTGITWASGYIQRMFNPFGHTSGNGFMVASKQLGAAGAQTATASWSGADRAQARAITLVPPDTTAPTITSSASPSVAENSGFSLPLTANEPVTWTKTGGADAAFFTLAGSTLTMAAKDYEIPTDANADNIYVVQVTATDPSGNATAQTISVTVTDVADSNSYFTLEDGSGSLLLEDGSKLTLE